MRLFVSSSIVSFVIILGLLLPSVVEAQGGLVACSGINCDYCALVTTIDNITKFIIAVMILVAVLIMIVAGFKMVASRGNPSAVSEAKKLFFNVVIGLIIILAAWTIVDTILKALTGDSPLGVWNANDCGGMEPAAGLRDYNGGGNPDPTAENENTSGGVVPGGTSVTPDQDNITSLRAAGVNVANWHGTNGPGRTDMAHPAVVAAIARMQELGQQRYGSVPFQVTAAFTEGVGHSPGSQHYNGIAVDLQGINGITNYQIKQLAEEVGFTFILDEGSHVHVDMR